MKTATSTYFVLELNDLPTLLRNDGGAQNNYLIVRTEGTKSNRDGIGARIKLRCGDRDAGQ